VAYREPNCQSDDDVAVVRPGAKTARAHPACELGGARVQPYLISSDTSIEAALEPVKLLECIGKGCFEVVSGFAVQPLCLD
jgi:hypothetical protein